MQRNAVDSLNRNYEEIWEGLNYDIWKFEKKMRAEKVALVKQVIDKDEAKEPDTEKLEV